jgi:hypothetical protein
LTPRMMSRQYWRVSPMWGVYPGGGATEEATL